MTEKNPKTKTLEVSIEVYNKLHSLQLELSEIFRKKISFDTLLKVLCSPKIIDYSELFEKGDEKDDEKGI